MTPTRRLQLVPLPAHLLLLAVQPRLCSPQNVRQHSHVGGGVWPAAGRQGPVGVVHGHHCCSLGVPLAANILEAAADAPHAGWRQWGWPGRRGSSRDVDGWWRQRRERRRRAGRPGRAAGGPRAAFSPGAHGRGAAGWAGGRPRGCGWGAGGWWLPGVRQGPAATGQSIGDFNRGDEGDRQGRLGQHLHPALRAPS